MTREIRAALRDGPLSAAEAAERLGVQTYAGRRRVREALRELVRRGEADRDGAGNYRLAEGGKTMVQEKLWRAVGLRAAKNEEVTVREAALLAEASRDYSKRYLRWLWRGGWLVEQGRGRYTWNPERTWREADRPHWNRIREEGRGIRSLVASRLEVVEANLARAMGYLEEAQEGLLRLREAGDGGVDQA